MRPLRNSMNVPLKYVSVRRKGRRGRKAGKNCNASISDIVHQ